MERTGVPLLASRPMKSPTLVATAAFLLCAACGPPNPHSAKIVPEAVAAPTDDVVPERSGVIRRGDRGLTLIGTPLEVGKAAPSMALRASGWKEAPVDFADGTVRIVLTVPSLDTPTCSLETRTFNEKASSLGDGIEILVVSRDLPPAQERFCAAHGIERVRALSDYYDASSARAWGLFVKELGIFARAVVIVDGKGIVRYEQIVENQPDEPDYDAALAAVGALVPKTE